jgi:formylglycine-generating enzyme required for sulfatase activity
MAYKPYFEFSLQPTEYAATPVPSISEWENLWAAWDTVTLQMIPKEELLSKPIKLRNACIFYLGHIPAFLAIHLHRAIGKGPEGLEAYQRIFERGIDPDVENPELCHDHSEIPEEWPPVEEVLAFQGRVRGQLQGIYSTNAENSDLAVQKALWISFEHEVMHLETLLYMLVQSERTQPPHGTVAPDFEAMAGEALTKAVPNEWFQIPANKITIGINDEDDDTTTKRYFGWDNEKPPRNMEVKGFSAKARPITNGEYAQYLEEMGVKTLPASWTEDVTSNGTNGTTISSTNGHRNGHVTNGSEASSFVKDKAVRTVFGKVPLKLALDWPIMASYDELAGCALWMGGRIPTMEEVRSIYEYVEEQKSKECEQSLGITIPAVNR